jgi:hypothetical protein
LPVEVILIVVRRMRRVFLHFSDSTKALPEVSTASYG